MLVHSLWHLNKSNHSYSYGYVTSSPLQYFHRGFSFAFPPSFIFGKCRVFQISWVFSTMSIPLGFFVVVLLKIVALMDATCCTNSWHMCVVLLLGVHLNTLQIIALAVICSWMCILINIRYLHITWTRVCASSHFVILPTPLSPDSKSDRIICNEDMG